MKFTVSKFIRYEVRNPNNTSHKQKAVMTPFPINTDSID